MIAREAATQHFLVFRLLKTRTPTSVLNQYTKLAYEEVAHQRADDERREDALHGDWRRVDVSEQPSHDHVIAVHRTRTKFTVVGADRSQCHQTRFQALFVFFSRNNNCKPRKRSLNQTEPMQNL